MKTAWIGVALLVVAGAAYGAQPDAAAIASQGNGKGAIACASCHGKHGGGQQAAGYPRLAGLNAAYLERQLDGFTNGTRDIPAMTNIARALTPEERHALAEFYARMPIPAADARGAPTPPDDRLGETLATRGMWRKQVPGCVKCHGPHGVGVGPNFPPLAGQPAKYIADQLHDWQQGKRRNDPLGLMQHVSSALDDADIKAVSEWFAAQPATLNGSKP